MEKLSRRRRKRRAAKNALIALAIAAAVAAGAYFTWVFPKRSANEAAPEPGQESILAAPSPSPSPSPTPKIELPVRDASLYTASLNISTRERSLSGRLLIDYVNTGIETLYSLTVGLYPNAVSPGCMKINALALNGQRAYYTLSDSGDTVTLPLLNELETGESCLVYFEFDIDLSMGYGDGLSLISPLPLIAEDEGMISAEPPEYAAPSQYRVRLFGDTLLIVDTTFEQKPAHSGYMFTAERAIRLDMGVRRG